MDHVQFTDKKTGFDYFLKLSQFPVNENASIVLKHYTISGGMNYFALKGRFFLSIFSLISEL